VGPGGLTNRSRLLAYSLTCTCTCTCTCTWHCIEALVTSVSLPVLPGGADGTCTGIETKSGQALHVHVSICTVRANLVKCHVHDHDIVLYITPIVSRWRCAMCQFAGRGGRGRVWPALHVPVRGRGGGLPMVGLRIRAPGGGRGSGAARGTQSAKKRRPPGPDAVRLPGIVGRRKTKELNRI